MGRLAQAVYSAKATAFQRDITRLSAEFAASERLDTEVIEAHQRTRAMAIALEAFQTTPFYRRLYSDAGFTEGDLRRDDVFDQLPRVTKADLRQQGAEMRSTRARAGDALPSKTGGSTGEPLRLLHDRRSPIAAMWRQAYRWWGVSPADNSAAIYRRQRSEREDLIHRLEWWPTQHLQLDASNMTPSTIAEFARRWRWVRPVLLNGYVNGVLEFAQYVADTGVALRPPRAIAVTAAPVPPPARAFMEATLGAPLYDCYRTAEVTWLAAQCRERTGLHVLADTRVVECLDPDGRPVPPGELGEATVTDLTNWVQPIIRYRIGDRTSPVAGRCACGMGLPRIAPVEGRQLDVLRGPSGRVVTGGLASLFNHMPSAVRQFQISQHHDYSITLSCVPACESAAVDQAIEDAADRLRGMLANEVVVEVVRVASIAHTGGKTRFVTSDAPQDPAHEETA